MFVVDTEYSVKMDNSRAKARGAKGTSLWFIRNLYWTEEMTIKCFSTIMMFSLICIWINVWVNNREAGDLRRHRVHHDVTIMNMHDLWVIYRLLLLVIHFSVFCRRITYFQKNLHWTIDIIHKSHNAPVPYPTVHHLIQKMHGIYEIVKATKWRVWIVELHWNLAGILALFPTCLRCFFMMTSSNGNIFHVTGPLCGNSPVTGEFPSQRPVTRSFDVFCPNKRLSKQSWGWWFETPSGSLWRHCNVTAIIYLKFWHG